MKDMLSKNKNIRQAQLYSMLLIFFAVSVTLIYYIDPAERWAIPFACTSAILMFGIGIYIELSNYAIRNEK